MRGRVLAVLILLLSFSSTAFPCSWTPRSSAQFRNPALDVSIDGTFVWVASGYGVRLIEHLPGGAPRILDSVALPGATRIVRADGRGFAYAGSGSRVFALRRDGGRITVAGSATASGTINDIELTAGYLFAATSEGIDHFSVIEPHNPVKTSAVLFTSSKNVTSLAARGSQLYAADGDATVEIFSIALPSIPQRTGALESLPLSASVHVAPDGTVFVSDLFAQNTDVFSGSTRLARVAVGARSFAASTDQTHFVAGADRTLRAVDFSAPSFVATRFEHRFAPTDGTENVIYAMARSGQTLYVAAGDIGLAVIDLASFVRPFPQVSYSGAARTSVRVAGDLAWFADANGEISQQKIVTGGISLAPERSWNGGSGAKVQDHREGTLLTSSGATATLWSLAPQTPAVVAAFTFPEPVSSAVIRGDGVVALLASGSVWTASPQSSPKKADLPAMTRLARSGSSIALAHLRDDGKTDLYYFAGGDLEAAPQRTTIEGAAAAMALDPTRAAVFTFTGINIVDLASGTVRVIPGSNTLIPHQLVFSGDDLLAADMRKLVVYRDARTLTHEHSLPSDLIALDATPAVAVIASADGTAAVSYLATPPAIALPFTSSHYSKVVAGGGRAYLLGKDRTDFYAFAGDAPQFVTSVATPGVIDLAATSTAMFTVAANGTVTAYSRAGVATAQRTLDEALNAQPRSIRTVGGAVWVSISSGCAGGTCQNSTIVLDPITLAATATMTGGIDDVVTSGTRAYALVDLPDEIRVIDVADPLHPSTVIAVPRPDGAVSIAWQDGTVHVLADRVRSYAEATLAPAGEFLPVMSARPSHRIRIDAGCAIVTGRTEHPQLYTLPAWTPAASHEIPSPVRSIAIDDERVLILTEHSLEIWSRGASTPPARRRAVR